MFDRDLERFADKIAFIEEERTLSYKNFALEIEKFNATFPKTKQLVAMEMGQDIDSIVTYVSLFHAGHTLLMVDPSLGSEKKEYIYENYKPNYIYTKGKCIKRGDKEHKLHSELTLLLPTSGSTGSVKYVRLSKQNIYANADAITQYLPLNKDDITITTLPLYYSYGLSVLHTYLEVGATLICSDEPITSKKFWQIFRTMECTNFNGVPFHYEILSKLKITREQFQSLRFLTQAGGKLNKNYVEEFAHWAQEIKALFFVMYGQTEATARISYLPPSKLLRKPTSIGNAIPDGKLFIQEGELVYEGKNVMLGYASSLEDLAKGDENRGRLYTGDLGSVDDEGDFYIIGRKKRFIKIYANRINLDEIEQTCKSDKKDVVVVGMDDQMTFLYKDENIEDLKAYVFEKYRAYKRAIKFQHIDEFIVTSSGKIDYQKMLELSCE